MTPAQMKEQFAVQFHASVTMYCCGLLEIGGMSPLGKGYDSFAHTYGKDEKDAWTNALVKAREIDKNRTNNRPLIFNFKKRRGTDKFDAEVFMNLVQEQEDCLWIHEWTNPNTGNHIVSLMLTNKSKVKK